MEIKVTQHFDKAYYEEYYREWLQFRSSYRKWQVQIGILCLLIGLLLALIQQEWIYIIVPLLIFGSLLIADFYFTKGKWMRDRLASKMMNQSATMIFEADQIQSKGPFTSSTLKWNFFEKAIETEKGVFLIPDNGVSIYLQKQSFKKLSDIQFILDKIRGLNSVSP